MLLNFHLFSILHEINKAIFWLVDITYILIKNMPFLHNQITLSYNFGWRIKKHIVFSTKNYA